MGNLKTQQLTIPFGFVFEENSVRESRDYCDVIVFKTLCVQTKIGVFKFLRFEERLRDGLVWKVELSVEIKLNFQISPHIVEGT